MFPSSDTIRKRFIFLTKEQRDLAQRWSHIELTTRLFKVFEVRQDDQIQAVVFLDHHIVRTHAETLLIYILPGGILGPIEVLAFEEPPDYLPTDAWFRRFKGRSLDDSLRLGRDIPRVAGSSITAERVLQHARVALAVWHVINGKPATPGNNKPARRKTADSPSHREDP